MPRRCTHPALGLAFAILLGAASPQGAAAAVSATDPMGADGLVAASGQIAATGPLRLAQYYAPPPPRPRYRPPHRRCWTETHRVVHYDRYGRPHVRFVPRTVCTGRRW